MVTISISVSREGFDHEAIIWEVHACGTQGWLGVRANVGNHAVLSEMIHAKEARRSGRVVVGHGAPLDFYATAEDCLNGYWGGFKVEVKGLLNASELSAQEENTRQ